MRTGVGLAVLPHFLGDPDPGLERYDVTPAPPSRDVWLLVQNHLKRDGAARAVIEWVRDCFQELSKG